MLLTGKREVTDTTESAEPALTRRAPFRTAAVLAALVLAAPLVLNAAAAPRPGGICDSFLSFLCPEPDPTDDPADEADPEGDPDDGQDPSVPVTPEDPTEIADPGESPAPEDPVAAPLDESAPVYTGTPAAMRSGGLSFTGLKSICIVSVPTVDGGTVRVLKISADSITISGFALTVRPPDDAGLDDTGRRCDGVHRLDLRLGARRCPARPRVGHAAAPG